MCTVCCVARLCVDRDGSFLLIIISYHIREVKGVAGSVTVGGSGGIRTVVVRQDQLPSESWMTTRSGAS